MSVINCTVLVLFPRGHFQTGYITYIPFFHYPPLFFLHPIFFYLYPFFSLHTIFYHFILIIKVHSNFKPMLKHMYVRKTTKIKTKMVNDKTYPITTYPYNHSFVDFEQKLIIFFQAKLTRAINHGSLQWNPCTPCFPWYFICTSYIILWYYIISYIIYNDIHNFTTMYTTCILFTKFIWIEFILRPYFLLCIVSMIFANAPQAPLHWIKFFIKSPKQIEVYDLLLEYSSIVLIFNHVLQVL